MNSFLVGVQTVRMAESKTKQTISYIITYRTCSRLKLRVVANITGDSGSRWQMLHYVVVRQSRFSNVSPLAYFTLVRFVALWPVSKHVGAKHKLEVETSATSIAPTEIMEKLEN